MAHDELFAISICNGLRPKFDYKIPQLILDVIKQCWNADPLKRPKTWEISELFHDLREDSFNESSLIHKQIKEANEINEQLTLTATTSSSTGNLSYTTHPQAVYTSRLLDFKNLPEPINYDSFDSLGN